MAAEKQHSWKRLLIAVVLCLFTIAVIAQPASDNRPTVTMKEYVDMQAQLLQKLSDVRAENIEANVTKATQALEKRLDGLNEFRQQLNDQVGTFPTRNELWGYFMAIVGFVLAAMKYSKDSQLNKK